MAKHDQRILKFLNQNADRAPTITEMMTRLNISISDISDSLGSLQAQGLIAKKTNNQGIECWFPTGPQASPQMVPPIQVPAPHLPMQQMPTTAIPILTDAHSDRPGMESRFMSGLSERAIQVPDPQPPMPKAPPVQVQHIPMAEPMANLSSHSQVLPRLDANLNGKPPVFPESQPAPKNGIGFLSLALGLIAAVAMATWLSGRLAGNAVNAAGRTFVEKKALTEATVSMADFQEKTKARLTALESEIKKLSNELAAAKAESDSLKALSAAKPEAPKAEDAARAKSAKKTVIAKQPKPTAAQTAIAKAAARGAAKKKKALASKASGHDLADPGASSAPESSPSSESSPVVPEPPGLEDLPPPPGE